MNGHILIIDDEETLRKTMARILQREGYEVTTAANGRETLDLVARHSFDLAYLDIRMPDMSGLELLKRLHLEYPDLPIILFTAQPDLTSAMEAVRGGAIDYLLKPLKPQTVVKRTKAILEKTQADRRRRDIKRQIDSLQNELNTLAAQADGKDKLEVNQAPASSERYVKCGPFTLDQYAYSVTMDGSEINLPPTSFDYLLVLVRHSPNVVDFTTLVAEAQGYETDKREAQELAKWHVHNIRQAIESNPHKPRHVINIRGVGYRLIGQ